MGVCDTGIQAHCCCAAAACTATAASLSLTCFHFGVFSLVLFVLIGVNHVLLVLVGLLVLSALHVAAALSSSAHALLLWLLLCCCSCARCVLVACTDVSYLH